MEKLTARADLSRMISPYRSRNEEWWAAMGPILLGSEIGCQVQLTLYEPLTFKLPGGNYRPDFLHILEDGRLVLVEIKGSRRQPNYRDARSKLRAAAELYAWAAWVEARVDGRGACEIEWLREVT